MMFSELTNIFKALTGSAKPLPVLCFLPPPVVEHPKSKGSAPKDKSSLFVIDKDKNQFGFYSTKSTGKVGAETWLTNFDKEILKARELFGVTESVQTQNATCKRLWATDESVDNCARQMKVSASWVEKRYACFGSALLQEGGGG